jgi:hypothetical protein
MEFNIDSSVIPPKTSHNTFRASEGYIAAVVRFTVWPEN